MKKVYRLNDLDCANCAAKMEAAICKLDGVLDASVNFMGQRLTVETADGEMDAVMKKVVKIIKKIEPDCTVVM